MEHAKDAIAAGEAIQVVLARRQSFDLPAARGRQPRSTASACTGPCAASTRRPYLFFTRTPSFEVVGASPELLLQVVGDRMTTHPIAGTRPRGATPADDDRLADELRGDPKERAEHVMLVDLGRNDLGPRRAAGHRDHQPVHGGRALQPRPAPREPRRGASCGRTSTRSTRCAPCSPRAPSPARPKIRAMQLIAAAEGERRGLYGGAVGYLGYDGNLDTAITIRSAVLKDGQAHVHTGAGIVAKSVPGARVRGDRAQGGGAASGRSSSRRPTRPAPAGDRAPTPGGAEPEGAAR